MHILYDSQTFVQSEPLFGFLEAIISSIHELEADEYAIAVLLEKYFSTPSSRHKVSKSKKAKPTDTTREDVLECLVSWFTSLSKGQNLPYHVMVQFLLIFRELDTEVSCTNCYDAQNVYFVNCSCIPRAIIIIIMMHTVYKLLYHTILCLLLEKTFVAIASFGECHYRNSEC